MAVLEPKDEGVGVALHWLHPIRGKYRVLKRCSIQARYDALQMNLDFRSLEDFGSLE